jgi:hypothetical protein
MHMKNLLNKLNGLLAEDQHTAADQIDEVTALGDRTPGRVEPDDPAMRSDRDEHTVTFDVKTCLEMLSEEFRGDTEYAWDEFEQTMKSEVPGWKYQDWGWDVQVTESGIQVDTWRKEEALDEATQCEDCGAAPCVCEDPLAEKKLTAPEQRKRETLVKGMKDADWEERYPGRGEEVMYATATKKAKELAETDETDDFQGTDECVSDCWDNERHSPLCPHYVELDESAAQLDEMRQLAGLTECGEQWSQPMAEPTVNLAQSKMTVTTSMDSEAGTKQVTVTAEGDGADELMRVLQMAGIQVAPTGNSVIDEYANEPNAKALDHKSMLQDLSGGLNAPHGQYNPDRARDNSMYMVGESVDQLAASLQRKFVSQK